jgi:glycosyltransferase involved in cell wall biosynthesis
VSEKMRIAIDIQALQAEGSRERGVGRYTFHALKKILELDPANKYILVANANLSLPNVDCLRSHHLINLSYPRDNNKISETISTSTLLAGKIDIFHIASPMELYDHNTYAPYVIPQFGRSFPFKVTCTCYDLIPYIYPDRYLSDPFAKQLYHYRLQNIREADHIFAISESTRQDIVRLLGVSHNGVSNVGAGVDQLFTAPLSDKQRSRWRRYLRGKFGIGNNFLFCMGGDDWRKRMEDLIRAFSELNSSLIKKYQLVISCKLMPQRQRHYFNITREYGVEKRVIFTNFVSNDELLALYSLCSLFVFPSEYEGFGIPVAEAMACGAPIITTNSSSLPEVLGDAGVAVEPGSYAHLSSAIGRVLLDEQLRAELSLRGVERAKRFSWDKVAMKMLNMFKKIGPADSGSFNFRRLDNSIEMKPRMALFSPVNPMKSGISDYTEELLPYLLEHFQIDLYLDSNYKPTNESVLQRCHWYDHSVFARQIAEKKYAAVLYQLGNSSYHAYMIDYILKYGGIITLHDYAMGGVINWLSSVLPHSSPNRLGLIEELIYNYGKAHAQDIFRRIKCGEIHPHELSSEGIFLNKRFFDRSIGLIVTSRHAYEMARKNFPDYPIECLTYIPIGVPFLPIPTKEQIRKIRRQLGIPARALVIASFGIIASPKRATSTIKAFAKLLEINRQALLFFVGECQRDYREPIQLIKKLRLEEKIRITGHIDFKSFYDYMRACDIVVNLNYPSQGGMSSTLLRSLSLGKPTVVSNGGPYAEFPDEVVLKVKYGLDDEDDVSKKLLLLACNEQIRERVGKSAYAYISKYHSLDVITKLYIDFILNVAQNQTAHSKLVADFAAEMLMKEQNSAADHKAINLMARAISQMNFL